MERSHSPNMNSCEMAELVCAYALEGLSPSEVPAIQVHIASCPDCQREVEGLRPVVTRFVSWPTDVLRAADLATDAPDASSRRGSR